MTSEVQNVGFLADNILEVVMRAKYLLELDILFGSLDCCLDALAFTFKI